MINSSKTFQHDDIHLWLADDIHMIDMIQHVSCPDHEEAYNWGKKIEIDQTTIEFPVYSSGRYLVGVCDCLVDYHIGKNKYALIIEMKPTLSSASGIIGQLKPYLDHISELYWDKRNKKYLSQMKLCVLTFDTNTKYDKIYEKAGIDLYRIPKEQTQIIR